MTVKEFTNADLSDSLEIAVEALEKFFDSDESKEYRVHPLTIFRALENLRSVLKELKD